jgi:hypothetical protein
MIRRCLFGTEHNSNVSDIDACSTPDRLCYQVRENGLNWRLPRRTMSRLPEN